MTAASPAPRPRTPPPRRLAAALVACLLLPGAALAQSDGFDGLPPLDAPEPAPPAQAKPVVKISDPVVVRRDVKLVPAPAPHSPATGGNWLEAPSNHRVAPSAVGSVGLVRTASAILGPPGLVRFAVLGEYYNQAGFPVPSAHHVRTAVSFAASFVPAPSVETFVAYGACANSDSLSSPTLIQALGDVTLGAKLTREWTPGLFAGADLRLGFFSGVGNQDVGRAAYGFSPRAVVSWDVRRAQPAIPLVVHANLGAQLDGTGALVRDHALNASEELSLGINRFDRLLGALALEVPLPVVTPFVEYDLAVPVGVERGGLVAATGGGSVSRASAMPQRLGIGVKVTAIRDLTLVAGVDVGLAGVVARGVPATPPWNVYAGASFNVDPFAAGPTRVEETLREREVVREVPPPPSTGRVAGLAVDAETQRPLPRVLVTLEATGLPPVASDDAGRFLSYELPPQPVRVVARHAGYADAVGEIAVTAGASVELRLALRPLPQRARFLVSVSGATGVPLAAQVQLHGPAEQAVVTAAGDPGPSRVELPPGRYVVEAQSPDFLPQIREVQIVADAEMAVHFELQPVPPPAPVPVRVLVVVKKDHIEILEQVHFETNEATILPESFGLLNQVAAAILEHRLQRVRVEGHTDNVGGRRPNQELSEARARSVATYLSEHGVPAERLDPVGFGLSHPRRPNLTPRGRELNRRVEFKILAR